MKTAKIAFFDAKPYDKKSFNQVNEKYGFNVKYFSHRLNEDTVILAKGFNVVCAFVNDDVNKAVIDQLHEMGINLLALRCAGYNNVELKAAYQKLHVVRVPAYSPYAVAEHTVALILSLNRKTHKAYYRTRDNNFNINGLLGFDMFQKSAGVIGTGKIGKVLIRILKGFQMDIYAYDLYPDHDFARQVNFKYTSLDELYQKSDIITLNCPLNKDTHHLINRESIAKMKDGVMLINTSRGQLLNTMDLIEGLKSKKIGSAGLDVYEEESEYFFEDFSSVNINDDVLARLLTFNNVLITSHQAFFTAEALSNIAHTTFDNISLFLKEQPLQNEICYQCGSGTCLKKKAGKCF